MKPKSKKAVDAASSRDPWAKVFKPMRRGVLSGDFEQGCYAEVQLKTGQVLAGWTRVVGNSIQVHVTSPKARIAKLWLVDFKHAHDIKRVETPTATRTAS